MFTRSTAFAALLIIPTIVDAQVRGERREDWSEIDRETQTAPMIKKSDLEKFSAIKLVVDKRKDLKLSDEQLSKFKDLDKQEEAALTPWYKHVDSLRLATRRRAGEDSLQERARTSLARSELLNVLRVIRGRYDSTFQHGLPLLDETQKTTVAELVQKERDEAEEDLREKLGGRGRASSTARTRRRP